MSPRRAITWGFGVLLAVLLAVSIWNPGGFLREGLQDNFISDFFTAIVSLVFFDQALDAVQRHRARTEREDRQRAALQMLDHDLHGLWSLLVPARPREDPLRQAPAQARIEQFLRDLADVATWNGAPQGHGGAVRARVRDLGEDAGALGLHALRAEARALDEDWATLPRGQLGERFSAKIVPEIRKALGSLSDDSNDD